MVSYTQKIMKKLILLLLILMSTTTYAYKCVVYFTGIGCPHCAKTDPFLLNKMENYNELILIEYEIYQEHNNAQLMLKYNEIYNTPLGVPLIIFGKNDFIIGDNPIISNFEEKINKINNNSCPTLTGKISFEDLNLNTLEGSPKIWYKNKVLIKLRNASVNTSAKLALLEDVSLNTSTTPFTITYSGGEIKFNKAMVIDNWILQIRGNESKTTITTLPYAEKKIVEISWINIITLALVDAVNPCALAVLILMLIGIIAYNPHSKISILSAGISFITAIYIIYLFYGLVIIKFFQIIQMLTHVRLILYKILAIFAILLGLLQLKDFFFYKPGSFGTEMPISWRPKIKRLITSVTSAKGAFFIGMFVTLFLLPCTIGPYIIAGGMLSVMNIISTLPYLLVYNLIFVLPMLCIVLITYFGFAKVEDVSGWKDKNIKRLHLIAGIILILLGWFMILGLV